MTGNIKRRFGDCIRWEGEKYEEEMGERNARVLACRNDCRIDDADRRRCRQKKTVRERRIMSILKTEKIQTTDFLKEKHFRH